MNLLFTSTPEIDVTIEEPLSHFGQAMIIANLSLIGSNQNHSRLETVRFDWNEVDWNSYCNELQITNWLEMYDSGDVNTILQNILNSM